MLKERSMLRHAKLYQSPAAGSAVPVLLFSFLVFFFTLADSTGQYIAPLLIQSRGFSDAMIGFIIGFSSIVGGLFDFIICTLFPNTNFRRLLLIVFVICLIYPLVLWSSSTLWLFLFAMAAWGIYYDLYNISTFDFIARHTEKKIHAAGFSRVQIFRSAAIILSPLIVGLIVLQAFDWRPLQLYWIYMSVSAAFFLALVVAMRTSAHTSLPARAKRAHISTHLKNWRKIAKLLLPMLILTLYLFTIDAFFWTLAPLYAHASNLSGLGGIFLVAYTLPILVMGWFMELLVKKFGKRRLAYACMGLGCAVLSLFAFIAPGWSVIVLVFVASLFIGLALPAINSAYADYIAEDPYEEGEIETLEDFTANISYAVGPMLAGLSAQFLGMPLSFSLLGVFGAALAAALFAATYKKASLRTMRA